MIFGVKMEDFRKKARLVAAYGRGVFMLLVIHERVYRMKV